MLIHLCKLDMCLGPMLPVMEDTTDYIEEPLEVEDDLLPEQNEMTEAIASSEALETVLKDKPIIEEHKNNKENKPKNSQPKENPLVCKYCNEWFTYTAPNEAALLSHLKMLHKDKINKKN